MTPPDTSQANSHYRAALERIVQIFETISPDTVPRLDAIYTPHARFRDPFNDVRGLPEIERIYAHMFVALDAPRCVVMRRISGPRLQPW